MHAVSPSRRQLFCRGRPEHVVPRLPWLDSRRFLAQCTACGACVEACPEGIISRRRGDLPAIDFTRGGCTFCGRCADACPESLFTPSAGVAWPHSISIGEKCLTRQGVVCQSCRDVCEANAIAFPPRLAAVAQPRLDTTRCTSCGACTGICPVDAIGWIRDDRSVTEAVFPARSAD